MAAFNAVFARVQLLIAAGLLGGILTGSTPLEAFRAPSCSTR